MKHIALIVLTLLLGACSTLHEKGIIQDRGTDYLKARSIPPLAIPPGLSSSTIHAEYPVSDRRYPTGTQEISLTPPELNKTY